MVAASDVSPGHLPHDHVGCSAQWTHRVEPMHEAVDGVLTEPVAGDAVVRVKAPRGLSFARSLRARGHDVLVTGQDAMRPVIEGAGFAFAPSRGSTLADPGARGDLVVVDRARKEAVFGAHSIDGWIVSKSVQTMVAVV